jgi:phosphoribosyl-ATP pyrophosphohydrolase
VEPAGPACHTGARSCFYTTISHPPSASSYRPSAIGKQQSTVLNQLYEIILDRQQHPRPDSYTARLFEQGIGEITKKVGEESVEVIVAALGQSDERLVSEVADLFYHTLVLLAARKVPLSQVEEELEWRRK